MATGCWIKQYQNKKAKIFLFSIWHVNTNNCNADISSQIHLYLQSYMFYLCYQYVCKIIIKELATYL